MRLDLVFVLKWHRPNVCFPLQCSLDVARYWRICERCSALNHEVMAFVKSTLIFYSTHKSEVAGTSLITGALSKQNLLADYCLKRKVLSENVRNVREFK